MIGLGTRVSDPLPSVLAGVGAVWTGRPSAKTHSADLQPFQARLVGRPGHCGSMLQVVQAGQESWHIVGTRRRNSEGPSGETLTGLSVTSAPGLIRTGDLLLRRQTLYPAELRAQEFPGAASGRRENKSRWGPRVTQHWRPAPDSRPARRRSRPGPARPANRAWPGTGPRCDMASAGPADCTRSAPACGPG